MIPINPINDQTELLPVLLCEPSFKIDVIVGSLDMTMLPAMSIWYCVSFSFITILQEPQLSADNWMPKYSRWSKMLFPLTDLLEGWKSISTTLNARLSWGQGWDAYLLQDGSSPELSQISSIKYTRLPNPALWSHTWKLFLNWNAEPFENYRTKPCNKN